MWKTLIAGTTILTIPGSALASAPQSSPTHRPHHRQLTTADNAGVAAARVAAWRRLTRTAKARPTTLVEPSLPTPPRVNAGRGGEPRAVAETRSRCVEPPSCSLP